MKYKVRHPKYSPDGLYVNTFTKNGEDYVRVRYSKLSQPKHFVGKDYFVKELPLKECELIRVKTKFEKIIINLFTDIKYAIKWKRKH